MKLHFNIPANEGVYFLCRTGAESEGVVFRHAGAGLYHDTTGTGHEGIPAGGFLLGPIPVPDCELLLAVTSSPEIMACCWAGDRLSAIGTARQLYGWSQRTALDVIDRVLDSIGGAS